MNRTESVWVRVCALDELPAGKAINVFFNGQRYVISRCGETAFVTQGYCSHMLYPLKGAKVEGCVLTCNLHGSQFSLKDGKVLHWPLPALEDTLKRKALKAFETKVEGGVVFVLWPGKDGEKIRVKF